MVEFSDLDIGGSRDEQNLQDYLPVVAGRVEWLVSLRLLHVKERDNEIPWRPERHRLGGRAS